MSTYNYKGMTSFPKRMAETVPYMTVKTGIVKSHGVDGYTVEICGISYPHIPTINNLSFSTNDTVKIIIPNQASWNGMFIFGKQTL